MNIRVLLFLTLSTLLGCKNDSNSDDDSVYFGGEIINPNNDYIVLNSPDAKSDTLYLNEQNRFLKKLTTIKAGLYTFEHGGEYQLILLEPSDSLMLRLNTIDFDESLVFTGKGARKNNYLISTFLENEVDNKNFMRMMWDMEPAQFEVALDSNKSKRSSELEEFLSKNDYSDYFKTIAKTNINYDYYFNKEMYPFGYYGYNNLIHFKDLPENFYAFRNEVDYNNENLLEVIPYTRFLFWHFNNLALKKYYQTATHNVVFDKKSVSYNLEKLKLMDSLISNEAVKNHLLKLTTRDFIASSVDSSEIDEVSMSFVQKTSNEEDKDYIKDLATAVKNLKSGNVIPNVKLTDYDGNMVDIVSLIKKPTVIFFWSSNLPMLLRNTHYKVSALKKKFPDIDFIAININDDDVARWKKTINQYKFSTANEYQFTEPSEAMKQFAINSVNRSILVDKNAKIINSNMMMIASGFEDELQRMISTKTK
jgi:hypothetical protein